MLLLPASLLALLPACSGKAAPEPVWIGHLAPFTGPKAQVGKHAEQGIRLAVEEANREENRIAGREVAVRHVDTGGDPKTAQQEGVRLLTVNKAVALLASVEAGPADGLGVQVQTYKVPVVVTASMAGPPASKNVFPVGLSPASRGQALARFVAEHLQKTPVAVLTPDRGAVPEALTEAFITRLGRERTRQWTYSVDADRAPSSTAGEGAAPGRDLEDLARNVKSRDPRAVLIVGTAGDLLRLRTALLKAGLDDAVPFLFGGDEEELTLVRAAEGVYAATAFWFDVGTPPAPQLGQHLPRAAAFAATYQARFGEAPDANAALAYDAARFLLEAMRRTQAVEGEKLLEQLAALRSEFEFLTGSLAHRGTFVVRTQGGRLELARFLAPT